MLWLHDTAKRRALELVPDSGATFGMYVCGPTVYGPPHVGHGRFTLIFDVLRRYLEYRGVRVNHVSNITDIDDKIIDRSLNEHRDWKEIADESEVQWWSAMDRLGVLRPHETPHATDYLEGMVSLIEELVNTDFAYVLDDGVYLATDRVSSYGELAGQSLASRRVGARVEVVAGKRSPFDFVLWKNAKPNEPSWPSPYGPGRPGWHTECVVMSLSLLGDGFELHGGGQDLLFPHHENERAQAIALGKTFARHWMHSGLVTVGGEKMSKSLGNFITLDDLLSRFDGRAYRLLVLQSHYRQPLEVAEDQLEAANAGLGRIDALARSLQEVAVASESTGESEQLEKAFNVAMENDLGTQIAVGLSFDALRRANALVSAGDVEAGSALGRQVLENFRVLGVDAISGDEIDSATSELVRQRDEARSSKDFVRSDELRTELESRGWVVEDSRSGTRVHRGPRTS